MGFTNRSLVNVIRYVGKAGRVTAVTTTDIWTGRAQVIFENHTRLEGALDWDLHGIAMTLAILGTLRG